MKKRMSAVILTALIVCLSSFTAFGAVTKQKLTVKDATNKAIQHSVTIRNITASKDTIEETQTDLKETVATTSNYATLIKAYTSIMQNEFKLTVNDVTDAAERQRLELSVTRFFASVIAAENDLKLYNDSLVIEEKNLEISGVKAKLGMMSEVDLETAKKEYAKKLREKTNKETAIETAYNSLNELMGSNLASRYELQLDLKYKPLGEINLPLHTATGVSMNADVKSKLNDVEVAQFQVNTYSSEVYSESKDAMEIKLGQAQRAAVDQQEAVAKKFTEAYNEIIKVELQYSTNLDELEKLNKQLVIAETKLTLGKATALDVQKLKLQIAQLEETIRVQAYDHEIKVAAFKAYSV